jgi:hypothetical protein
VKKVPVSDLGGGGIEGALAAGLDSLGMIVKLKGRKRG